jgi:hypothetical protein
MISLQYRELWGSTSKWLTDELDQMAASAQAKWFTQHDGSGAHTAVTADSLSVQALRFSPVVRYTEPSRAVGGHTVSSTLVLPAGTRVAVLQTTSGSASVHYSALRVPSAVEGDVVCVVRGTDVAFHSSAWNTTGVTSPYPTMTDRILLNRTGLTQTATGLGGAPWVYQSDTDSARAILLMRVDTFDFEGVIPSSKFAPCWVQIG